MKVVGLIFYVEKLHEKKKSNTYSLENSRCCLKRLPQDRALDKEYPHSRLEHLLC